MPLRIAMNPTIVGNKTGRREMISCKRAEKSTDPIALATIAVLAIMKPPELVKINTTYGHI